jgi:hypothetical protein
MRSARNIGLILTGIWLILFGLLALPGIGFPASGIILAILAIAAGVLLLIGMRDEDIFDQLGYLLLGLWLLLEGLLTFPAISFTASGIISTLLALAAGIFLLIGLRGEDVGNSIGHLLLGIWLILEGLLSFPGIGFTAAGTIMAVLAVIVGIVLLVRRA